MPGSIITCQGLSTAYNSYYYVTNGNGSSFRGLTIDAATDTFNVDTSITGVTAFPFNTGDILFYTVNSVTTKYYVIRISPTSIKVATTYARALANEVVDLTSNSSSSNVANNQHQISSLFEDTLQQIACFDINNWQGRAFSTLNFSITEKIRFDFTLDHLVLAGISSNSYTIGFLSNVKSGVMLGRESIGTGGSNRFFAGIPTQDYRLSVSERVITISQKQLNSSYTTIYTTATITNTEKFRFFTYFSLNNTKLSNCIITYL